MLSILYLVLKRGLYLKTKEIQNVNRDDLISLLAYFVYLKIIDLEGREVKTLINSFQISGNKSVIWNATNNQGRPVAAGMYFYLIESGDFLSAK